MLISGDTACPLIIAKNVEDSSNGDVVSALQTPSAIDAESDEWKAELASRSRWWSLQVPKNVQPPNLSDDLHEIKPVDRFIIKALKESGLSLAEAADAETLLRRLSFVLTGLPPTPEKVEYFKTAFARDPKGATETAVDEFLSSPHYGEQIARHWMDVVRYSDTYGYEWDNPAKGAWEFRDYLIRAFNDDVPFDQLIREHIAGDLLPEPRINPDAGVNESLIAPMFFHMGEHRHETSLQFNGVHQEMIDNKIDAFSKAFLAMTVACARCHDHKLDAISQRDYYALAGVFMSPRWTSRIIDEPGKYGSEISELKELRSTIWQEMGRYWKSHMDPSILVSNLRRWRKEYRSGEATGKYDDLDYPLSRIPLVDDGTIKVIWKELADEWQSIGNSDRKVMPEKLSYINDFQDPGFPEGWILEGDGLLHGYVKNGTPLISLSGESIVDQLLQCGYHTHALSSKLAGAIRLPDQGDLAGRFVSFELKGGNWSGLISTPQNAFQNESVRFLVPNDQPEWITIEDALLKNGVTKMYTQVVTAALNPNFPPRMGKAIAGDLKLPAEDDGLNHRSWFSLTGIGLHDEEVMFADSLIDYAELFDGSVPSTLDDAWQIVANWFTSSISRWISGSCSREDVRKVNWLLKYNILPNIAETAPEIARLVKQYREVEARIGFPRAVNSMDERAVTPMDYRINLRGDVNNEGPAVPRNFLGVFSGKHKVTASNGSGRLELANYLSGSENPQTARVYVNRVWQWIFGKGLVDTPSDFGKLGDRPSHPELLDWLATKFIEEGWSTKRLVRQLLLSRTFCQSGIVDKEANARDPQNRLLHHYETRRLEAEGIRDNLLAVSGSLNPQLYGPPINPLRTAEDPLKRLLSGPLDGHSRRSIYLEMSIMDPPKMLVGFNLPSPKVSTGRRDVTNVPAQALILLNHPFVKEMSKQWAGRLLDDDCKTPRERISRMYVRAFGRSASGEELDRWEKAYQSFSQMQDAMSNEAVWTELAHTLFNTKEFIYYR